MFIFRWIAKIFRAIGTALSYFNKALLYALEIIIVVAVIISVFSMTKSPQVQPNSILVLDLEGTIKELPSADMGLSPVLANAPSNVSLHELLATLDKASKDPMIDGVLLKLDKLQRVGMASIEEIGKALEHYKTSGKPIWAWGTNFTQSQYALASHANEIYMHPMGEVLVKGLASNRLYYGELLNTLGIKVHVFKAGAYKSFPESFVSSKPSKEWIESERFWLTDAWETLSHQIESSRGLMPGFIDQYISSLDSRVVEAGGDLARTALQANLIDGTLTYDQMQKTIASKLNRAENKNLHFVSYTEYKDNLNTQHGEIAVIIAEGEIQEGQSQSGITGAETLVSLIDQARENPSVKALVLRVNSPGGSAVASELIRHAIETTKSEKPVIVSMGDLAASGGFWISMGASKVLAASSTITGSIGVFGLAPTFENTLKLAKIGQGTVATTWLANAERLTQPMDPRLETIFTQSVAKTYANFVNIVAQSRKLTPAYVQTVAQGRVWTGSQAAKRKLVDEIGDFQDAIKLARSLAHLDNNAGFVYLIEPNADLGSILKESIEDWISPLGQLGLTEEIRSELKHSQRLLQNEMNAKLFNVYAHSLLELIQ